MLLAYTCFHFSTRWNSCGISLFNVGYCTHVVSTPVPVHVPYSGLRRMYARTSFRKGIDFRVVGSSFVYSIDTFTMMPLVRIRG